MRTMFALLIGIALAGTTSRAERQTPKRQGLFMEYVGLDGVQARYVGQGQELHLEAMRDRSVIYDAHGAILTDLQLPPPRAGSAARQFAIDEAVGRARERLEQKPPSDRAALLRLYAEATQALVAELRARGGADPELFGFDLHLPILLRAARPPAPDTGLNHQTRN